MFTEFKLKNFDLKLMIMVIALATIGVFAVGSAEPSLKSKQLLGVISGALIMLVLTFINYSFWLKFYWLMYIVNIFLLALVMFSSAGQEGGGAQRWLQIGGLKFQPSEAAKILLILFFAQFIMKYREKLNTIRIISLCLIFVGLPWALIYEQPDLSTSVVLIVVFAIIMFAGGISYKLVVGVLAVAVPAIVILVMLAMQPDNDLLNPYQRNRIMAFVSPEEYADKEAYQQLNSIMAIGSGQLNGKGYMNNEITSVKNGKFLSEENTDFIFAVIGEEFGFKGCVLVIGLLMGIAIECIGVARRAKDLSGKIIAASMGGLIAFQGFFNIGVATFILPNTGLPLPFVSYGITSIWSLFAGMGFVMNIRLQAKKVSQMNEE